MGAASEDACELKIERLSYGPDAIAHLKDGKTVFVSNAVPGDVVKAKLISDGGRFARATAIEVLSPSPDRVRPPKNAIGHMGCPWSIVARPAQLLAKRANVIEALEHTGHMDSKTAKDLVRTCIDLGEPWGYRNKVELAVAASKGHVIVGMSDPDGKIHKIKNDALLDREAHGAVRGVSGALGYLLGSRGTLGLTRVGIRFSRRTHALEVALWGSSGPFPRAQAAKLLQDGVQPTSVVRVLEKGPTRARRVSGVERLSGTGHWEEVIGDERMLISAPSFFQVNTKGADTLVQLVMEGLDPQQDESAMDLYCGAGTFTMPLARRTSSVSAVESYGPAVRDLRRNLERAGLDNVWAEGGDAGREFPEDPADIIVVDPPRAGLAADVVDKLSDQPSRAIAYVSCDPATLARDLARFAQRGTFVPESITPVDLFPQTFHVETVTILRRR